MTSQPFPRQWTPVPAARTARHGDDSAADWSLGELHRAAENDEFALHYQPVVDLSDGQLAGAEGLLRWQHPRLGTLSADAFILAAVDCGLLSVLLSDVMHDACRTATTLRTYKSNLLWR